MRLMAPVAVRLDRTRKTLGFSKLGRPIFPIAGGAPTLEELRTRKDSLADEANGLIKKAEGKPLEGEELEKLRTLDAEFVSVGEEIKTAEEYEATTARFRAAEEEKSKERQEKRAPLYSGDPKDNEFLTPGEQFLRSDTYGSWMQKFPSGGPPKNVEAWSGGVDVGMLREMMGMPSATDKLRGALSPDKFRDLVTSAGASAGSLVQSLRRGLIETGLQRPLTVRDLVTVIPVTTDTIEFVVETSRANNADTVADATALTGTTGLKPEGALAFEPKTDHVRTIAEWIPATRRILSDAPQLRNYIDAYLTDDLALELEDQMVDGSGSGEDFEGILQNPLCQTADQTDTVGGTGNILDILRACKRLVRVNARTNPNAVLINPEDLEAIDTLKASTAGIYLGANPYAFGSGNQSVWGMPLVESEAVPAGTAIVANFKFAVLYDREQTNIQVGTANDDFIRNLVRILAELRAGFGIIRPKAFVIATL